MVIGKQNALDHYVLERKNEKLSKSVIGVARMKEVSQFTES